MHNLKLYILFSLLFIATGSAFAQNDSLPQQPREQYGLVVSAAPNLFAPGIKFEFPSEHWSFGFHVKGYWPFSIGGKVEPFARVYFKREAPKGLFLQLKLTTGAYYEYYRGFGLYSNNFGNDYWYASVGTGIAFGHQWILKENANLAIDLYGGIQASVQLPWRPERTLVHYYLPGFPLELGLRIGKAFYRR